MVTRFVYLNVSTHGLIPSPYLLLYPLRGDTHANIRYPHGHGPWLSRARRQHHLATTVAAFPNLKRHTGLGFLCVVSVYKWAFGWAFFGHCQASEQASLHITSNSSLVTTSVRQADQAHQAHTSPHKLSEAGRWKVSASYPCLPLCLVFAGTYPEAIVAPFLSSSRLPRARWAVVAVFFSGLSMHKVGR